MSREARAWLKIVSACLVPRKCVTHVTRERVCLVYAFMTRMQVNVGEIIKDVLRFGPGFEEPLDDDVATDEEMARVDSDKEFDEEEEDSDMGKLLFSPLR
ncbi:hypothetical protein HAX54_032672 [Datura stramonium]|uniref:Uncharacterized protein n=1 Tax=Datura stramonium TaxID=4076 RepID=A0ABS8VB58_DATST|nr:hypothetical protein [Datura stramonium]